MDSPHHIAIVEDDAEIRAMTAAMLEEERFRVTPLADGQELDRLLARELPDLVLLDLMLPGEDGLSICRRLVAMGGIRVLMVTARGSDIDRIIGLELGADDYLPKPFNPRELLARVRAVLRRAAPDRGAGRDEAEFDRFRISFAARSLTDLDSGREVELSSAEFDLLWFFVTHPGRVLSRDQLLDGTRGRMATPFDRSVDVLISKLRRKLDEDSARPRLIKTVRGDGYMFTANVLKGTP